MTISKLNVASGLVGASALGLMFAVLGDCGFNVCNDGEPSFIFANIPPQTFFPLVVGGFALILCAIAIENKKHEARDAHQWAAFFTAVIMAGICCTLYNGFGPEMTGDGWNQPSNATEKGLFGGLWGGFLAASTGVFGCHVYKGIKP